MSEKAKDRTFVFGKIPIRYGEEVRFSIVIYRGYTKLDIREFYTDRDGEMRPTQRGIRLPIAELPQFRKVVKKLYRGSVKLLKKGGRR